MNVKQEAKQIADDMIASGMVLNPLMVRILSSPVPESVPRKFLDLSNWIDQEFAARRVAGSADLQDAHALGLPSAADEIRSLIANKDGELQ